MRAAAGLDRLGHALFGLPRCPGQGQRASHPVIEYQLGSVRDDFNLGSVLLFNPRTLKAAAGQPAAGLPESRASTPCAWPSRAASPHARRRDLYGKAELDVRTADQKQFDYVDPKTGRCKSRWSRCHRAPQAASAPGSGQASRRLTWTRRRSTAKPR